MKVLTTIQLILTLLFFSLWIKMRWSLCMSKLNKAAEEEEGGGGDEEEEAEDDSGDIELNPPEKPLEKIVFYSVYYAINISKHFFRLLGRGN